MNLPSMHLYRQPEIKTHRPYAFDVDAAGWLWEGQQGNLLYRHNVDTAESAKVPLGITRGRGACDVKVFGGMLVIAVQDGAEYVVYDPASAEAWPRPIPGETPHIWYMSKLPDGRLVLYERHHSRLLILEEPLGEPRLVKCPYEGNIGGGFLGRSDGLLYMAVVDPARLIRFDPRTNRFVDELACSRPEASFTGRVEHSGTIYFADSSMGRLLPFDIAGESWGDPIAVPGHGEQFGFVGGSAEFGGLGIFATSSYRYRSRLDMTTGNIITVHPVTGERVSPEEAGVGVDGRPHRFLGQQLVFDPATHEFGFLAVPEQPDGLPLLCYNWSDGERLYITGHIIPFGVPGEPSRHPGDWIIFQSHAAEAEPGFDRYDFSFDKKAHINATRRRVTAADSLYIPFSECTPPIVNLEGSVVPYPAGVDQRLKRRAARTDTQTYLQSILDRIVRPGSPAGVVTAAILRFVHEATYYNPIDELADGDGNPVALLESHDIRCGGAATVMTELLTLAGVECRRVGLHHHVVVEAHFDNAWRLCDALFFGANPPQRDGQWLSVAELQAEPYFADAWPQDCFVFAEECVRSCDDYYILGYNFGIWGWEPYYSYYLGAPLDAPPTLPHLLPPERLDENRIRLRWAESLKRGGGKIEYALGVYADRAQQTPVLTAETSETSLVWKVPEANRMYFIGVRAMDDHREKNADTWYPTVRGNFVLAPKDQYGWYNTF